MSHRFLIHHPGQAAPLLPQASVTVDGDQAHHAMNVMRFRTGDSIILFDGCGNEYDAIITENAKKKFDAKIERSRFIPPNPSRLTIAVALPKGDRQKFLIEKLVELGVDQLIPLHTFRSVAIANDKVIERFEKAVIEASKQCARAYLMRISPPHTVSQLIESISQNQSSQNQSEVAPKTSGPTDCFLADPTAKAALAKFLSSQTNAVHRLIAIGPEGGFDEHETAQFASHSFQSVSLSDHILRIETAAIAAAVLFRAVHLP